MAYDQSLANRVREALSGTMVTEKEMFGGLAWLRDGKMFIGIVKDELMVRIGKDAHDAALKKPHVRTMDFTGRPMKGYVFVGAAALKRAKDIAPWAKQAMAFVKTVKKSPKPTSKARPARRP